MKATVLESEQRFRASKQSSYGIISYGERDNDYPQRVREILAASVTGSACNKIYKSFVNGKGFVTKELINDQNLDDVLEQVASDYCTYGGFCLHLNYDLNIEICSIEVIPFEFVRFAEKGGSVKIHPDWGRRNTQLKQFDPSDIVNIRLYNPETVLEEVIEDGGWENYKGQVFYYSNRGPKCYPLPIFDAALTDMVTEEAISDITYRNSKHGFLPAGMFVNISTDDDVETGVDSVVKMLQGSKNANKIAYAQVKNENEIPRFVNMAGQNYDKDFTVSREAVKDSVGRVFNQPAILRCENVSTGFDTSSMVNAYMFYNSVTEGERAVIKRVFEELLPDYDFTIIPLQYNTDDIDNKESIVSIIKDQDLDITSKRSILKVLYKLNDEQIEELGLK